MNSWSAGLRWALVMAVVAMAYLAGRWVAEGVQRGAFG